MFVWPTAKKVNAINTSNEHFGYFCFVFSLYGSSMKHFECWMWRVSSFYTVVQIAKFSEGRIYRHTLITMKCGHWYPGIFYTHRQNSSGMYLCACKHTYSNWLFFWSQFQWTVLFFFFFTIVYSQLSGHFSFKRFPSKHKMVEKYNYSHSIQHLNDKIA